MATTTTATASIPSLLTLAGLPYLITHGITLLLLSVFIMSWISPRQLCASALFPQAPDRPLPTFFYIFAVRELVLGLALLLLQAYGEWRAVVVLLACISINGIGDFFFAALEVGFDESVKAGYGQGQGQGKGRGKEGAGGSLWWAAFKGHGVPTIAGYWAAWRLWQEHW
ncbi:uncharacterized protein A1O9_09801 [Exophiala aquamarina CBS 119918]|uniref:Uncharacterized protein n=1 Tax=Exophiala aquamarina CBS 119918 TaxID=1182545 RepID=A0A072P2B7_9EURO|nr:uncharacterized protein A1O9_09801 [Exophiala aquamarina CBS 119918]KEF54006.1 hypothetical protein A1O9_09801 [Exophiala aquamarina CBS 119918]